MKWVHFVIDYLRSCLPVICLLWPTSEDLFLAINQIVCGPSSCGQGGKIMASLRGEGICANGSVHFIKIFAQISDSVRNFNEFAIVAIAVDWGFIHFYFFGPGFWTLCVIKYFCQDFGLKSEILMEDLVNKSSRISGFAYPYSRLSSLHFYGLREKCPKNSHLDFMPGQ